MANNGENWRAKTLTARKVTVTARSTGCSRWQMTVNLILLWHLEKCVFFTWIWHSQADFSKTETVKNDEENWRAMTVTARKVTMTGRSTRWQTTVTSVTSVKNLSTTGGKHLHKTAALLPPGNTPDDFRRKNPVSGRSRKTRNSTRILENFVFDKTHGKTVGHRP